MTSKRVGILGATFSGKLTLLKALAGQPSGGKIKQRELYVDHLWSTVLSVDDTTLSVFTIPGPIFYVKESLRYQISLCEIVIHVASAAPYNENQSERFRVSVNLSEELEKSWTHIPWLFVLNKIDKGSTHPFPDLLPASGRERVLRTVATKRVGVQELADELFRTARKTEPPLARPRPE